eukprot:XP_011421967.1 PREDICTED: uncharacterized protein LOC105324553 [Crassostrea gigas]
MMIFLRLAALVGAASLSPVCWRIPRVDQQDYCYADIAFTVERKEGKINMTAAEYDYDIKTMYKGNPKGRKLIGRGVADFCGTEVLDPNTIYLIYAKTDDEGDFLRIVSYKEITDVTYEDIERMKKYYDCSCKISINNFVLPGAPRRPSSGLSDPPLNGCEVPFNYCRRSAYCKNIEGKCTWGNHGECN